jgi:two-component system, chemotaxis family, response regulator WspF
MKIAIVNDMLLAVEALRRVVSQNSEYEVIWVARDGAEAVCKCHEQRPDVVLMDLIMPVMDGVEATRRIMTESPCAILIVTATVQGNSSKVYEAMGHGALDAVATPTLDPSGSLEGGDALMRKIGMIGSLIGGKTQSGAADVPHPSTKLAMREEPLLLIGASTGGPQAVAEVLAHLPQNFPAAIVLVQHVDRMFAAGLATWLHERSRLPVQTIRPGDLLKTGTVSIAATNDHLILRSDFTLGYTPNPKTSNYRPSIDVFFKSVAASWRGKGCAILLTGMGRDGAEGLLTLRQAGFLTIAQDKRTSIVYGMPKAAAELGAAEMVLSISLIGQAVRDYFLPSDSQPSNPSPTP